MIFPRARSSFAYPVLPVRLRAARTDRRIFCDRWILRLQADYVNTGGRILFSGDPCRRDGEVLELENEFVRW